MDHKITYLGIAHGAYGDTLLVALLIAAIIHTAFILGVNFVEPEPERINHAIDITLADRPVKKAPKKATFLAQAHQVGGGEKKSKPEPPKQSLPSQGSKKDKPPRREQLAKPKATPKKVIATTDKAEVKTAPTEIQQQSDTAETPQLTAEALEQQIAQFGAQVRERHESMDLSKIKHVNAVSTHKYLAAQYMKDWEEKVERTGNLNYPEVARKKDFSGTLTMEVGINPDGSVYNIRIKKSSGNQALDDAAKRIVRISEPFPPLPKDLLEELDVLVITRVWKFSDESGMTTR
ncbi:MAG: energy transducer TonB [Gammaproteobacteria bacterium]